MTPAHYPLELRRGLVDVLDGGHNAKKKTGWSCHPVFVSDRISVRPTRLVYSRARKNFDEPVAGTLYGEVAPDTSV